MPARLTLYPPKRVPRFLIVRDGESFEIGRDPECGLVLEDTQVSRRHARLSWVNGGWTLEDLGSKNGTRVNGEALGLFRLADGDWISLGGLMARFEMLTAVQAAGLDADRLARLQTSAEMHRRLAAGLEPLDLLERFLEIAVGLAGAERGFVLVVGRGGKFRPEVAAGYTAGDLQEERFRGSVGAVKEVLETGEPLIVSEALADPRLGKRPSVVAQGIGSLACLPLRQGKKIVGLLYADSRNRAHRFDPLDLEMLEMLADRTASVLAQALRGRRAEPSGGPSAGGLISQMRERIEELLQAP